MGSGSNIVGAFSSDTTLPTPVPINKGGTGQTTAQAAIDALTDVTSASTNDVLQKDGSGNAVFAAAAGGGGAWSSLGTDVLTSTNTTMSVTLSSQKKYLMVLANRIANGALDNESIRFNGSSASDYAYRHATDGAGDSSNVNATGIGVNATNATQNGYLYGFVNNDLATSPKMGYFHDMRTNTDYTAGKEPARQLTVGKWQPSSGTNVAITAISLTTAGSGDYQIGSSLAILGSDGD